MKVALAADHAGLPLRDVAAKAALLAGHDPVLVGPDWADPVDYPDVARELCAAILEAKFTEEERHVRRLQKVFAIEASGGV